MVDSNDDNTSDYLVSYHKGPLHSPVSPPRIQKCTSPQMTEPLSPQLSTLSTIFGRRVTSDDGHDEEPTNGENASNESDDDDDDGRFEDYASNICFLVGSILYVWLAVWDIIDENDSLGDDDGDDDDADDDPPIADDHFLDQFPIFPLLERRYKALGVVRFLITLSPYVLVSVMAAWCYVIDAGFQIAKLICHNKKPTTNDGIISQSYIVDENGTPHSSPTGANNIQNDVQYQRTYFYHNHGHVEYSDLDSIPGKEGWWRRQRCISAAVIGLTFGVGAAFDLASGLIVDSSEDLSDMLSMIACHIYLLNAIIVTFPIFSTCSFKQPFPSLKGICHCHGDKLEYIGDLLFLVGSIIDVMLSYWNLEFSGLNLVNYGYLLSAVLWLIDAIFYIAADYIGYEDDEDEEEEEEEDESFETANTIEEGTAIFTNYGSEYVETSPIISSPNR